MDILRAVSKVSTTPALPGSFLPNGQHYKQQSESPNSNIVPLVTPRIPPKLKAAKGPPSYPVTTDYCLISPSTSPPPDRNPPTSHTQSQSSPSLSDPESAPSCLALPRASAAPPLHSDPPTALRLPYSARPAPRSAHSSPAPDPPASPPTSFLPSPFVRPSTSGRYLAGATASARGYTSTFPSAAPQSRLREASAAACNSTHSPARCPPGRQSVLA